MKRSYQLTAVILACVAAFIILEANSYDYMTGIGPGGGFFPLWLGIALLVLSGAMFVDATISEKAPLPADFFPDRGGFIRLAMILGAIALTVVLMKPLGFRLTMLGFLLLLLGALGRPSLLTTIVVALLGSFGVAYVFSEWLRVTLPIGIFGI